MAKNKKWQCYRCRLDEADVEFDKTTRATMSTICLDCFAEIKQTPRRLRFLYEEAKVREDNPNFDVFAEDNIYVKEWNEAHPIIWETLKDQLRLAR